MRAHILIHNKTRRKRAVKTIDGAMTIAAVIHPLVTPPQVIKVYQLQNATDLSLVTWAGYSLLGLVFLTYALVHNIKPLILTQVLWFLMDAMIIVGIILYG